MSPDPVRRDKSTESGPDDLIYLGKFTKPHGLRGQILGYGPNPDRQGWDEVSAHVPQGELWDYIIELRTLTQGLGYYTWKFDHLSPVPPALSTELVNQASAAAEAVHH